MKKIHVEDIEDIKIGHCHDKNAVTGCSVFLFEKGVVAGVDVRGGAPGTRETALLSPDKMVEKIHAIMLAGGSAFGLNAASGAMKFLEEKDIGFETEKGNVPIVSSAILYDLDIGDPDVRPEEEMGYKACINTDKNEKNRGNIGAGMGATVGKIAGPERMMKGGLGTAAFQIGDLQVGAVVVVNCLGDIIDPKSNTKIAGVLNKTKDKLADTEKLFITTYNKEQNVFTGNTSLGIVMTNAKLTKNQINNTANRAHNAYARTMSPSHTQFDGDTIFAVSTGKVKGNISVINILAQKAVERAVIDAIVSAESLEGILSYKGLQKKQ